MSIKNDVYGGYEQISINVRLFYCSSFEFQTAVRNTLHVSITTATILTAKRTIHKNSTLER